MQTNIKVRQETRNARAALNKRYSITIIFVSIFLFHAVRVEFKMEGVAHQYQGSHEVKMHDIFKLMVHHKFV